MKNQSKQALPYTKENVTKWLISDLRSMYSLTYSILNSPAVLEAIAVSLVKEKEDFDIKQQTIDNLTEKENA